MIEERRSLRTGGTEGVQLRARIVAATNADLPARVAAGTFRADLWFRLSVVALALPPLRARPADMEDLARHFLRRFSRGAVVRGGHDCSTPRPFPAREAAERDHIRRVLAHRGGRIGDAAVALGVSRTTLWDRMRKLGLTAR